MREIEKPDDVVAMVKKRIERNNHYASAMGLGVAATALGGMQATISFLSLQDSFTAKAAQSAWSQQPVANPQDAVAQYQGQPMLGEVVASCRTETIAKHTPANQTSFAANGDMQLSGAVIPAAQVGKTFSACVVQKLDEERTEGMACGAVSAAIAIAAFSYFGVEAAKSLGRAIKLGR